MYLLFDVGGTHTRLGLTQDGIHLEGAKHLETEPGPTGFAGFLGQLEQFAAGMDIKGIAGGLPGHPDHGGFWQHTPNLPGWSGRPVQERLESQFGVPVTVVNDASLVGLGEATEGAGEDENIVVYITVSTGVNGARITGGRIDATATGFELGEVLMSDPDGRLATLESLVGGAALEAHYGRPPAQIKQAAIWKQEAKYLAQALRTTILHWSPDVVVYGGPMMRDVHVDMISHELAALPLVFEGWPPVRLAQLGDDGGLYGALALIQQMKHGS